MGQVMASQCDFACLAGRIRPRGVLTRQGHAHCSGRHAQMAGLGWSDRLGTREHRRCTALGFTTGVVDA